MSIWDMEDEDLKSEDELQEEQVSEEEQDYSIDEVVEQLTKSSEERETRIISSARSKLEQARLYEILINHKIFNGVDSDDEIVSIVETEIKEFILDRLEILLGMKEDSRLQKQESVSYESPFSDDEVSVLKILAAKVSGNAPSPARQVTETPKPKQMLNSINLSAKKPAAPVQAPVVKKPAPQVQRQASRPVVKQSQTMTLTEQEKRLVGGKEKLTEKDLLAAKKDLQYFSKIKKPAHKMSKEELIAAAAERPAKPRPPALDNESTARQIEMNAAMNQGFSGGFDGASIAGILQKAGKMSVKAIEEV